MYIASSYVRAESLDEAWELNQKRNNKIMGGNCWLRMGKSNNINTIISLSKLGLDKIEENDSEFKIGAMVTLRQIETNNSLNEIFNNTPYTSSYCCHISKLYANNRLYSFF